MTFVLTVGFGIGFLLLQSAIENVSIIDTFRSFFSGQAATGSTLSKPTVPAVGAVPGASSVKQ